MSEESRDGNPGAVRSTDVTEAPTGHESAAGHIPHHHGDSSDTKAALVRLLLIVAAGLLAAALTNTFTTVLVVLAVIAIIMVHELGHFATAKWSGMKVTEYFLGFGPTVWSIKRGETTYGVKAIPAGGYVRIAGMSSAEEVPAEDEHRTYRQHPYWQQVMVAGAGPLMHFVMGFLMLFVLYGVLGTPVGVSTTVNDVTRLQNGEAPAAAAGIRPGDKVLSINGTRVDEWNQVQQLLAGTANQTVDFVVERDGRSQTVVVRPIERRDAVLADGRRLAAPDSPVTGEGFVGIRPGRVYETVPVHEAAGQAATGLFDATGQVIGAIGDIFSPSGLQSWVGQLVNARQEDPAPTVAAPATEPENRLVSPVGLVSYANNAADSGIRDTLMLLFSINLFVGILNLVPLPPFDGGHIAVATYERLRSRNGRRHRADHTKLLPVAFAVMFFLISLSLSALWLDIVNPPENPFR